jgi:formylglycine-generating enzyme required for sulfatase activity
MKQLVVVLLIFYCFLEFSCFTKMQKKVPAISQIQDIPGFIRIDGGLFTMGSPEKEIGRYSKIDEEKLKEIIVDSFYIAQHEVTRNDFFSVMKNEIIQIEDGYLPVNLISWFDAIEFCNKLSELHGLEPVYTIFYDKIKYEIYGNLKNNEEIAYWNKDANEYRLPTSAEWECAVRAGTKTPFYTGETITVGQANFDLHYPFKFDVKLMPVGSYQPNQWNLYDMAGNVYEWCWDWYDERLMFVGKIARGGDFLSHKKDLRSAAIVWTRPTAEKYGFRLARSVFLRTQE